MEMGLIRGFGYLWEGPASHVAPHIQCESWDLDLSAIRKDPHAVIVDCREVRREWDPP